ncbi:MAG TPA: hypothetical protein PLL10_09800, partial [Elusimicrobiales bacterium]|nr:hypothetical protein [Elusimicrobiales bacterium]
DCLAKHAAPCEEQTAQRSPIMAADAPVSDRANELQNEIDRLNALSREMNCVGIRASVLEDCVGIMEDLLKAKEALPLVLLQDYERAQREANSCVAARLNSECQDKINAQIQIGAAYVRAGGSQDNLGDAAAGVLEDSYRSGAIERCPYYVDGKCYSRASDIPGAMAPPPGPRPTPHYSGALTPEEFNQQRGFDE